MQKIALYILAILTLLLPIKIYSQAVTVSQIVITEIGTFETSDEEWIEILNTTTAPVDMTGWKFFENQTNHGITAFRGDAIIDPGEYAVIANKADLLAQKYTQYTGTIMDSSWSSLSEDGEEIGIKDNAGNLIESFIYSKITKVSASTSIERVNINIVGEESTNWVQSIEPNSIGIAYTIPVPVVEPVGTSTVTTEEIGITATDVGTTTTEGTTTPEVITETNNENSGPTTEEPPPETAPVQEPVSQQIVYVPSYSAPQNSSPTAVIQVQSGELIATGSTTINFDGRASADPNGDKIAFLWDLGDGSSSTSSNPGPHKYSKPGVYTVTLTVTDSYGAWGKTEQNVQVLSGTSITGSSTLTATSTISTSGTSTPPAKPVKKETTKQTVTGMPEFIDSTLTLHGYFVFVPTEEMKTVISKKTTTSSTKKIATPASTTKAKLTKTTGSTTKKQTYLDGDISDSIQISELLPAPAAGEEEWIEIFNAGDQDVYLGNWDLSNKSKAKSPFIIPDTKVIPPNGYIVFPKSETKIALNNSGDTVVLRDFDGSVISAVTYEKSEPAESYGLVSIISSTPLSANSSNAYVAQAAGNYQTSRRELTWEWIDSPTPGAANPVFEKIDGTISGLIAGNESTDGNLSFDVSLPGGSSKTIRFSENTLNPVTAETVLTKGTNVSITAEKSADGSYELHKIDEVREAEQAPEKSGGNSFIIWSIVIVVASGAAFGLRFYLIRKRRQLFINRA